MKITQSQLEFSTSHFAAKESISRSSLKLTKSDALPSTAPATTDAQKTDKENPASSVQISNEGLKNLQTENARRADAPKCLSSEDPKLSLLRMAIEMLTGKKISITGALSDPGDASANNGTSGLSLTYEQHTSYTEMETSSFSAQGVARTADGSEISFQLDLSMSRFFHSEEHIEVAVAGKLQDPLVLNFSGTAAELSNTTFSFDLFDNGTEVDMRALTSGSGFLSFDRNSDGKVNNGSELFGVRSGDGFADLAQLDDDGNGWIDEGDSAFASLYLWNKDAAGRDVMTSLKDAGVGAIALAHAKTPFALKDSDNQQLGQITDTGVFLMEKGGVGTVQKVDVVV